MKTLRDIASTEEVALFNPAFLARLLRDASRDFERETDEGMPVALCFLITPLVLHKATREELPINAGALMQKWIRENPRLIASLEQRVHSIRPFVGVALRFGLLSGALTGADGRIFAGDLRRRPPGFKDMETVEVDDCLRKARFLGRWFARQPDMATSLAFWGLRP